MTRIICAGVCLAAGLVIANAPADKTPSEKPIRVLIVTGCDVPAHPWRKTTAILREHLEQNGRFEVVVSEEPLVLESSALEHYDVVLINYYNWKRPSLTDKAKEGLLKFVRSGKGLVSFHYSCRAFSEWPEYRNLIGRIWADGSGHGARGKFETRIVNQDHFITEGLEDFEADDELYSRLVGDAKINVLAEAYSEWSGQKEPLAWTLEYGKGRVFNIVFGHDEKACRNPNVARLLVRGTQWTARQDTQK